MIKCDDIIEADTEAKLNDKAKSHDEETKTNFNEKKAACKTQHIFVLLAFLLITMTLLVPVSIYCFLIKYWAKQLLHFHYTNNELKEVLY